jgi:hypothetical protein
MRISHVTRGVVLAALVVAAPALGAQSLAERVSAVKDGTVQVTYAARPDACGDGNDVAALGMLITVYPSMRGHGHSNANCFFGPVRTVITRRDGEVTAVRAYIGAARRQAEGTVTDLGTVTATEAAC